MDTIVANANNYAIGNGAGASLIKSKDSSSNNDNILIGTTSGASLGSSASGVAMQNIIIGNNAAKNINPLASQNVIIGYEAAKNSNGVVGNQTSAFNNNVAIGTKAGYLVSNGSGNVILGSNAGNNTSFSNISNKLIISNSNTETPLIYGEFDNKKVTINGDLTVTGKLNEASRSNTTFTDNYSNVFVGQNAGINYQDVFKYGIGTNTAVGVNALQNNTDYWNVAIGGNALTNGTKARQNTAIGYNSMYAYKKGFDNVIIHIIFIITQNY
jgi:hypothetical protein